MKSNIDPLYVGGYDDYDEYIDVILCSERKSE